MRTKIRENLERKYDFYSKRESMIYILSIFLGFWIIWVYLWRMIWFINLLMYVSIIFSPILIIFLIKFLWKIKNKTLQNQILNKVSNTSLVQEYPRNINFINHHNYFKNHELEEKYKKYVYIEKLRSLLKNGSFIFAILLIFFLIPETFSYIILVIISGLISLILPLMILIWKDKFINKLLGRKNTPFLKQDTIYFRRIDPSNFQKSWDTIFFY